MSTALLWYRRDLRVHDHPALHTAVAQFERVVPVFVLDDALLHGRFASAPRTAFLLGCLRALDDDLRERGSGLVVRHGVPERALVDLAGETHARAVLWTSDVAPYARARDLRVTEALRGAGVQARPHGGAYVVDVSRPRTQGGDPYSVFSPFWRRWQGMERRTVHRAPRGMPALPSGVSKGRVPREAADLGVNAGGRVGEPVAHPGEAAARDALTRWLDGPLSRYHERQDELARPGTSGLSPYLRWGCLSPRELEERARHRGGEGAGAWVRQLCWRDFYAHVLLMWPSNARHEFQERFRDLEWEDPGEHLKAWQRGETGFPVVDAAMRQLAATGWMHNRARLIVGSFLTKDLHLDWRHGEAWFERLLLDGEPAQNNGNWQWIASVGTDPAPPFRRMYNPTLQGRRFDPSGEYVRRWVSELAGVPDEHVHEPWAMSEAQQREAGVRLGSGYPAPIVDHKAERRRALEFYRRASRPRL
ncbi:MAG TPA: deoxyribodipyrimidine photo-lyase [Solirubrobacteraceae bacterium]|nr:deoxyribodipyrimidine photo-lyase [Solirubrobacteraceae bacterium]